MDSIKTAVKQFRNRIHKGKKWHTTIEKRRFTKHHKDEIVRELAELIDEKLTPNPDKILRVNIIGKFSDISVLEPKDIFSATVRLG
jgi:tRNA(Ser,Leu) C12 N-acetylase TAN1